MSPRLESAPPSEVLTVAEAAAATGKSRSTIARLLASGRLDGAVRDDTGAWRIPTEALAGAGLGVLAVSSSVPPAVTAPAAVTSISEAALRAELADWRCRAEVAEALAAERADALDDLRKALRLLFPGGIDPFDAFWAEVPEELSRRRRRRPWRRRA